MIKVYTNFATLLIEVFWRQCIKSSVGQTLWSGRSNVFLHIYSTSHDGIAEGFDYVLLTNVSFVVERVNVSFVVEGVEICITFFLSKSKASFFPC